MRASWSSAVRPSGVRSVNPGRHLPLEPGHAHLEELVEVAAVDAEELEALEQRGARVERLVQHAAVELEPAQLAIDVQRRMPDVEVEQGRRRRRGGVAGWIIVMMRQSPRCRGPFSRRPE